VHPARAVPSSQHEGTIPANPTHDNQGLLRCPGLKIPMVTRQGLAGERGKQHSTAPARGSRVGPARDLTWGLICTDRLFQSQQFCMIPAAFPDGRKNRPDK